MSDETITEYPESEKLAAYIDERNTVMEFLDFLHAKNMWICDAPGENSSRHYPILASDDRLIMQFLGVDEDKLEQERRAMLSAIRVKMQ